MRCANSQYFSLLMMLTVVTACGNDPGSVSITFKWECGEPPKNLWIFGRVIQVSPGSQSAGQIISEMDASQEYSEGMSLFFPDIQNQDNLAVLLEARGESTLESRVLYYGISNPFSLMAREHHKVDVMVAMDETPTISKLAIEEAVGPEDCLDCFTSSQMVTLKFIAARAVAVEVANDSGFTICNKAFFSKEAGNELPRLVIGEEDWRIVDWELDCGLEELGDGPRSVFVRLLDESKYPSQTLSANAVLDREPPKDGTIMSANGGFLFTINSDGLKPLMLFGVIKADELWVEACQPIDSMTECQGPFAEGLLPCDADGEYYLPTNQWTDLVTRGCVQLKNDSISRLRVKYRDFARNETPWVEYVFDNVVELKMPWILISGGTYKMGCSPNDIDCLPDEKPPHWVTLDSFEILQTEVTEGQYEAVAGENPSCDYGGGGGNSSPVECVDWYEAKAFCETIGGRLCTEAEWEYAARGTTTTKFYSGDALISLVDIAWYAANSGDHKHDVMGKAPNLYGLYDMLGNVWEWTADLYDEKYYSFSSENNPKGPSSGSFRRVYRGGSYGYEHGDSLRVSDRFDYYPSFYDVYLGFRCCKTILETMSD
jgi:formylglycine-generating enzyme required for sulfatase activity